MDNSAKTINALIRNDFTSFIHKVFNTINPGTKYYCNWHIELISEYLKAVERGDIKRLIINMPPRSLKSVSISVAWPAWLLAKKPESRIMVASYSQILSTKLSLDTRFVMNSDWYNEIFPATRIHPKQNQKNKFLTTKYGFRFATSVGGSATGEGGDILIVDDPHNPANIASTKIREKVINWYKETFSTRLNNRHEGRIVIVMQRLHEDDLTGYLVKNRKEEWKVLKIPTLATEFISYKIGDYSYVMEEGETIHHKLFNSQIIEKLIKEIGQNNFLAQYQQSPVKNSSSLLNTDHLKFYTNLPSNFSHIILSWDTAVKVGENSDYSACTIWGIVGDIYYLISCLEHKYEYPQLKKQAKSLYHQYLPSKILIEDKASGQSLIQDLRAEGMKNIVSCKPVTDKITRLATCMDLFEAGKVLIPATGYHSYIVQKQLLNFPGSKHDDIVDSISQFLNYIKKNNSHLSIPRIRNISANSRF